MNGLSLTKLNEEVAVTCYGKTEKMTRREAMEKFYEGMMCSDGSEHERYETIFFQLLHGNLMCSDLTPLYSI